VMGNIFLRVTPFFVLMFFMYRYAIKISISRKINRSNIKNRSENENFFEWLTYKKFKGIVPKWLKAAYFSLLIVYLIEICVWGYLHYIGLDNTIETILRYADIICLIPLIIVFIKKR
jgi:hypothetical protein